MATRTMATPSGLRVDIMDAVLCDAKIGHFAVCRHHAIQLSHMDQIQQTGSIPDPLVVYLCNCVRCNHPETDLDALAEECERQAHDRAAYFGKR